jgi:glycolate oxidase
MPPFQPVTSGILEELSRILGTGNVLTDASTLDIYGRDETEDLYFAPEVVVRPATLDGVSAVLRLATRETIPVTPRGGGTGLSGGALPVHGGILLSMERFNHILEIDERNLQAVVEPGVVTETFQSAVEEKGLFYPPDPASRGSSHLGGNLAECAGGPHAVKYGVTRDYVIGLEAVLPSGEVLRTGARVLKNASGYHLTHLLIGSEGTLAVITKIFLRLIPLPRHRKVLLVAFSSLEKATAAVATVFQRGVTPATCEFLERAAVEVAERRLGKKFPNGEAAAQLIIEVDGNHEPALAEEIQVIAQAVEQQGATDLLLAEEPHKIKEVWDLRRGIGEAVKAISAYKEEDTVVPRAKLPDLVTGVKEICERHGIRSICYGHAGDGNVHVNLLKGDLDDNVWARSADEAVRQIFRLTVSLGGAISGEHGIGYTQKGFLPIAMDATTLRLMKEIKAVFDPAGILNPGKLFPE